MSIDKRELEYISSKYKKKINKAFGKEEADTKISSQHYEEFRTSFMPKNLTLYEKWCNFAAKSFKVSPDKKQIPKMEEAIRVCHLNTTPTGVYSFAVFFPLIFCITFLFLTYAVPLLAFGSASDFFIYFGVIAAIAMMIPLSKLPFFFANTWRMKASNQMVLCVFYIVTYMRHTSNLERAINFAAEHIGPPLSIDLKKVLWDVETQTHKTIKESLDKYLENWKEHSGEFVEAIHLIESSLYETSEARRLNALDKSLSVMLDETYEKMLHYAHDLKSPITNLMMLGIILPVLGLVTMPLAVGFVPELRWYHIFSVYNLVLPIVVYYFGKSILSKRPTGYGDSDLEDIKEFKRFKNIIVPFGKKEMLLSPALISIVVFIALMLVGSFPLVLHAVSPDYDCWITDESPPDNFICGTEFDDDLVKLYGFNEYIPMKDADFNELDTKIGPFGLGATILSMFVILAFGLSFGLYYKLRSSNLMKIRDSTKKLEKEFGAALFQLGNRLGDGIPPEIAFSKVSEVMEGTSSGNFFRLVSNNIRTVGLGVEAAIFDPKIGALKQYPSALIESSMKVLVESSKKGPLVASQALINVSEYIKEMHRVDERLRDLMADVIASMNSQISFLTPIIVAIVMGLTSMIAKIMINIGENLGRLDSISDDSSGLKVLMDILGGNSVPIYFFSIVIGLYVVQITGVMSVIVNGISNGADKLNERFLIGKNVLRSTMLYVAVATGIIILFNIIAGNVMANLYG